MRNLNLIWAESSGTIQGLRPDLCRALWSVSAVTNLVRLRYGGKKTKRLRSRDNRWLQRLYYSAQIQSDVADTSRHTHTGACKDEAEVSLVARGSDRSVSQRVPSGAAATRFSAALAH